MLFVVWQESVLCLSPCKQSNRSANRIFWKVLQTSGLGAPAAPHGNGILETLRWSHKHIYSIPTPLQHLCKDRLIHFPPQDSNFRCIELYYWPPVLRFPNICCVWIKWLVCVICHPAAKPIQQWRVVISVKQRHLVSGEGMAQLTSRGIIARIIQLIIHAPMMTKWPRMQTFVKIFHWTNCFRTRGKWHFVCVHLETEQLIFKSPPQRDISSLIKENREHMFTAAVLNGTNVFFLARPSASLCWTCTCLNQKTKNSCNTLTYTVSVT